MKRLSLALAALLLLVVLGVHPPPTQADPTDFVLTSIDCASVPGHIKVTNTKNAVVALNGSSTFLTVVITPPGGGLSTSIRVSDQATPTSINAVNPNATIDLQVGPGAAQNPNPFVGVIADGNSVALTSAQLLLPGASVQLSDGTNLFTTAQTCPAASVLSRTLTVATFGFDLIAPGVPNSVCGPDLPVGTLPTAALPGPCRTIANALFYARDGDTVLVEAGVYEVCDTIELSKLVKVTANGNKVILHSFLGVTVFHVTAVGASVGPVNIANHAAIDGFAIGGAFQPAQAAIMLDGDAFTDVTNNVLGGQTLNNPSFTGIPCPPVGQPLPTGFKPPTPVAKAEIFGNAAGIILANSDHPNISNNSILGSAIFQFSPVLATGDVLSGFGIVTAECLGLGSDASDGLTLGSNLIERNVNAGVWMCSDGGGLHQIRSNAIRNNGRGVILRGIADSLLDANVISDDYQDAVVLYDASENNTISNNTIESSRTPGAAGIRLGGFGAPLHPLATTLTGNKLLRNWFGLVIAGARNTVATGNTITAEDIRTAVLLQVGSVGAVVTTQPSGTQFHQNQIIYNGACAATAGCAIRLDNYVTVDVDATGNNFGLPPATDVNTVLWHKPNDPTLGYIKADQTVPSISSTPAPVLFTPSPFPANTPVVSPSPSQSPTPSPASTPLVGPACVTTNYPPGCLMTPTPTPTPRTGTEPDGE
ncbi:MAG TPA: right-handed parallel beta-helix repeat-containing protein [Dehalococcoidia bacterium]|nr:right-handed parallel beta-helix repeat-containing protein [Dehalococcoidia bacterium]